MVRGCSRAQRGLDLKSHGVEMMGCLVCTRAIVLCHCRNGKAECDSTGPPCRGRTDQGSSKPGTQGRPSAGTGPWGQRCSGCNSCGLPPGHQTGVPQGPWWDWLPDAGSWWPSSAGRPRGQSWPGSVAGTALLSHNSITQPPFCTSDLGVSVKALHPNAPTDGLTLPPEPSGQDPTAGCLSGVTSE